MGSCEDVADLNFKSSRHSQLTGYGGPRPCHHRRSICGADPGSGDADPADTCQQGAQAT